MNAENLIAARLITAATSLSETTHLTDQQVVRSQPQRGTHQVAIREARAATRWFSSTGWKRSTSTPGDTTVVASGRPATRSA